MLKLLSTPFQDIARPVMEVPSASNIVVLCVILGILSIIIFFSVQGFRSIGTEFRQGDPFTRSQPAQIDLTPSRINNVTTLARLGYTPDPGSRRYVFIYDNRDPEFHNARRAGFFIPDGVLVRHGGCLGVVSLTETISGDPPTLTNVHFDFNAAALHAYGTHRILVLGNMTTFVYDIHGRNARTTITDYTPSNEDS